MGASAGTVTLELDANSVKLLRELKKTQRQTQRTARSMKRHMGGAMKNIARSAKAMGVAMVAAFAARLLRDVVNAGLAMDRFSRTFKIATGSVEAAAAEMEFIDNLANKLGIDLLTSADAYAKLTAAAKGTSLAGIETRRIFTSLAEATMVLGLSAADATQILTAVEQMISKGKVSAEELRRQMQKMPGAFAMAARSIGVTTMQLDKMLKNGELMAEDLLPKLAVEMHKTFGPGVEEASTSTQASLARFKNAILSIRTAIAESGVMDALSNFAQGIANVVNPGLGLAIQNAQDDVDAIKKTISSLKAATKGAAFTGRIVFEESQLSRAELILDSLLEKQGRLLNPKFTDVPGDDKGPLAGLDAFIKQYETAAQKIERLTIQLNEFKDQLDPAEFKRIQEEINKIWSEGLEEINVGPLRRMRKVTEKTANEMTEFAKQAARNMQDAFADFLFDPFSDGLKGMLKGFLDILRRMIAEAAAARFFGGDSALAGFLGGFIGAKALGGPVAAGSPYLVGERGPEVIVPGTSGTVIPNNKLGGISVVNNFSIAAGADWETLQKVLPPLFEQNRTATIAQITQMKAEGAV